MNTTPSNKRQTSVLRKGFSLIEILIVVVLIGIIVAAAIPAVSQYKAAQVQTTMISDGQRIGIAAQAYFAETLERTVALRYNPKNGILDTPNSFRLLGGNKILSGYSLSGNEIKITFDTNEAFVLKHPTGGTYTFSDKGELVRSE